MKPDTIRMISTNVHNNNVLRVKPLRFFDIFIASSPYRRAYFFVLFFKGHMESFSTNSKFTLALKCSIYIIYPLFSPEGCVYFFPKLMEYGGFLRTNMVFFFSKAEWT